MSCQCEILSSILQRERKKLLKISGMWVSFGAFNACFVCVKYCCLEAQNDPHKKCLNVQVEVATLRSGDYTLSHHFRCLSSVYVQMRVLKARHYHSSTLWCWYTHFIRVMVVLYMFVLFVRRSSSSFGFLQSYYHSFPWKFVIGALQFCLNSQPERKQNRKNWKKARTMTVKRH